MRKLPCENVCKRSTTGFWHCPVSLLLKISIGFLIFNILLSSGFFLYNFHITDSSINIRYSYFQYYILFFSNNVLTFIKQYTCILSICLVSRAFPTIYPLPSPYLLGFLPWGCICRHNTAMYIFYILFWYNCSLIIHCIYWNVRLYSQWWPGGFRNIYIFRWKPADWIIGVKAIGSLMRLEVQH